MAAAPAHIERDRAKTSSVGALSRRQHFFSWLESQPCNITCRVLEFMAYLADEHKTRTRVKFDARNVFKLSRWTQGYLTVHGIRPTVTMYFAHCGARPYLKTYCIREL